MIKTNVVKTDAIFGNTKQDNLMFHSLAKLDFKFIEKLAHLLDSIKKRGGLPAYFQSETAAYALFSIFITQYLLYVYTEDITLEEFDTI